MLVCLIQTAVPSLPLMAPVTHPALKTSMPLPTPTSPVVSVSKHAFVLHVTTFASALQSVASLVPLGTTPTPTAVDVTQSTSVSLMTPVRMGRPVSLETTTTPTTTAHVWLTSLEITVMVSI